MISTLVAMGDRGTATFLEGDLNSIRDVLGCGYVIESRQQGGVAVATFTLKVRFKRLRENIPVSELSLSQNESGN